MSVFAIFPDIKDGLKTVYVQTNIGFIENAIDDDLNLVLNFNHNAPFFTFLHTYVTIVKTSHLFCYWEYLETITGGDKK